MYNKTDAGRASGVWEDWTMIANIPFTNCHIEGGFWQKYQELVREVSIRRVYERFRETGRFDALRCDWKEGEPHRPHFFWDSDVAKWIESVAYLLEEKPDPSLYALAEEAIADILKSQRADGYYNCYYLTVEPENIFRNRDRHELYCAGHLIEAAIAWDHATGERAFLDAMCRYADLIYRIFYEEHSAGFVTPGHEEIELALLKLYLYTKEKKYLTMAAYFLEERGRHPDEDVTESYARYNARIGQSDRPARELEEAAGHAVRAGYLYTAMALCAGIGQDEELYAACRRLFDDIVNTKLSITGGVGACINGEAFGKAYILPNRTNYNETCAAIALALFAEKMQELSESTRYADMIERILFNGMLSGLSLDGTAFFYENALEIHLADYGHPLLHYAEMTPGQRHEAGLLDLRRLHRAEVFDCSCCPPNITRILASMTRFFLGQDGDTIYCYQFAPYTAEFCVGGKPAGLRLMTEYPASGHLRFTYQGEPATLAVRIPDWCTEYAGGTENGFAKFPVTDGDTVEIDLPMAVHFIEADPKAFDLAGLCAVTRGPVVYCMEEADNGPDLSAIELAADAEGAVVPSDAYYGIPVLELPARRRKSFPALYRLRSSDTVPAVAKLIPYFAFANREICDMATWFRIV